MTPIKRIDRLRCPGVFRDYKWPEGLPEFGRYNLIHGWNGSGKTTISRVLRALELRVPPVVGEVTLSLAGDCVGGPDFPSAAIPVRVFNRDFMGDSVFPVNGEVAPILVLGKESVDKQRAVAEMRSASAAQQEKLASDRREAERATAELDRLCVTEAKAIKDTLRSGGSSPYNEYDKRMFSRRADEMDAAGDGPLHVLSEDERGRLLARIRSSPKPSLSLLVFRLPELRSLASAIASQLSRTAIAAAIEALKDDPELSSWLQDGVRLHRERGSSECLYCEQTIPRVRTSLLETHFSNEYSSLLSSVDSQIAAIGVAVREIENPDIPRAAELWDDLVGEYESAVAALRSEMAAAARALQSLREALELKRTRPFEAIELGGDMPALDVAAGDRVNDLIRRHNQACAEFHTYVGSAKTQLEADSVASRLRDYVRCRDKVRKTEQQVAEDGKELERLRAEIERLEADIVEHRRPATEFNEDLSKYLGHAELQLEVRDTGYAVMRSGEPATSLSEGEITAIALLYFLKSLQVCRVRLSGTDWGPDLRDTSRVGYHGTGRCESWDSAVMRRPRFERSAAGLGVATRPRSGSGSSWRA